MKAVSFRNKFHSNSCIFQLKNGLWSIQRVIYPVERNSTIKGTESTSQGKVLGKKKDQLSLSVLQSLQYNHTTGQMVLFRT